MTKPKPTELQKRIMKQRGVEFKKLTRKATPIADTPSIFKKTNLMKLIEMRHKARIEDLIFIGTIYDVEKLIGVDATTVSKWRRLINKAKVDEFFEQFD